MYFFFQVGLSGLATGAVYGLIAVGYSLTFITTKVLNFALGMWVMLGGMLTYSLQIQYGVHPLVVLVLVPSFLFFLGLIAERFTVLPFLRAGSDVWVLSTLAVGLLFIDLAELIWGRSPTPVPSYFGKTPIMIGQVSILSPGTDKLLGSIPMKRLGTPDEVAKIIYVLCTETASYLNGAEIHIDGGQYV